MAENETLPAPEVAAEQVQASPAGENEVTTLPAGKNEVPAFSDFMNGYDEDAELHDLFPKIKEQNFTSDTFREALPDEAKTVLRGVFEKLGFNQRQANAAMMLAADSYCSGVNYGKDFQADSAVSEDAPNSELKMSEQNLAILTSEDYKAKYERIGKTLDMWEPLNFALSKSERGFLDEALKTPAGVDFLDKVVKVFADIGYQESAGTKSSASVSGPYVQSSGDDIGINGSNYQAFPYEQQASFIGGVARGELKDRFLSQEHAKQIISKRASIAMSRKTK